MKKTPDERFILSEDLRELRERLLRPDLRGERADGVVVAYTLPQAFVDRMCDRLLDAITELVS